MQGAAATSPALARSAEMEAPSNQLLHAKGSTLSKVLNVLLWVGMFGLASILTLPR